MSIIEEIKDEKVVRIHCAGAFKFVMEDWMLDKLKEKNKKHNKGVNS